MSDNNWQDFIRDMEANMSGDELEALNSMREHYRKQVADMGERPNLIERMDNLIHSLNEAHGLAGGFVIEPIDLANLVTEIDNALGIAGEILTMIDGR